MYFFQTYFKRSTPTYKALSTVVGIGHKMAIQTCDRLGVSQDVSLKDLSPSQITQLNQIVYQNILVEDEYRALIRKRIKRLTSISCYRGFRHLEGLPCRGQRTHTNARTSRKGRIQVDKRKRRL